MGSHAQGKCIRVTTAHLLSLSRHRLVYACDRLSYVNFSPSPIHSPLGSMTPMGSEASLKSTRDRGMTGARGSARRGTGMSPAESSRDGSVVSKRTGHRRTSSAGEGDGGEDEEDQAWLQLEGVRLVLFLLGHVCPLSRRTSSLAVLYQLLDRTDLTTSGDELSCRQSLKTFAHPQWNHCVEPRLHVPWLPFRRLSISPRRGVRAPRTTNVNSRRIFGSNLSTSQGGKNA